MTAVVALEADGGVWVGCDSYVGDGASCDVMGAKWFQRGPLLIAGVGSVYAGQVAEWGVKYRTQRKSEADLEYIVVAIAEPIRGIHRATHTKLDGDSFVVAYNGRAYWIGEDYGVHRSEYGYLCAGSGESWAEGAMAATPDDPPEARVRKALLASEKHYTCVRAPFHTTFVPAIPPRQPRSPRPPKGTT